MAANPADALKSRKKQKVKAGKLAKSKNIAKVVRNTRKKGKKQLPSDLAVVLKPSEQDVIKMLAAQVHIGRRRAHVNMKRYIWKRRDDGVHIFNLEKTWAKLVLAARIIVAVRDPSEVMIISSRTYGQRGAIKFAKHTGTTPQAGKWIPGTLTNPQNKAYAEPRLIITDDPSTTFATLRETSYIGIPVIAFCNADNNTRFVDCAIPCNNRGRYSIGLMFWFLAREVLRMRGAISRSTNFNEQACVDLFFYRDQAEIAKAKEEKDKKERQQQEAQQEQQQDLYPYDATEQQQYEAPQATDWAYDTVPQPPVDDWGDINEQQPIQDDYGQFEDDDGDAPDAPYQQQYAPPQQQAPQQPAQQPSQQQPYGTGFQEW